MYDIKRINRCRLYMYLCTCIYKFIIVCLLHKIVSNMFFEYILLNETNNYRMIVYIQYGEWHIYLQKPIETVFLKSPDIYKMGREATVS